MISSNNNGYLANILIKRKSRIIGSQLSSLLLLNT